MPYYAPLIFDALTSPTALSTLLRPTGLTMPYYALLVLLCPTMRYYALLCPSSSTIAYDALPALLCRTMPD